jgi:hypothetical protein
MSAAPPSRALYRPPWAGFRVVFALVNGALWFALTWAILTGVSLGLVRAGHFTARTFMITALAVAFFVGFFGAPGAMGGLLDQARSGRFVLPSAKPRGHFRPLAAAWRVGAAIGVLNVGLAFILTQLGVPTLPSRASACQLWSGGAALLAVLQSLWLARPAALIDLDPPSQPATAPTATYYVLRFALPQGLGNGVVSALMAAGLFSAASGRMAAVDLAGDAVGTAGVIAFFMVFTAGGLARTDRLAGRVAALAVTPPPRIARWATIPLAALLAVGLAYGLGTLADGLTLPLFVAWKAFLGCAVAAPLAALAARWELSRGSTA